MFKRSVREPRECEKFVASLELPRAIQGPVWVYRYEHNSKPWKLFIGTRAEPHSKKFSLGGFRIEPLARMSDPTFNPDEEAIRLACGMEGKVHWTRLVKAGGPRALENLSRIVGGKCVLLPSVGSRIGEPEDFEMLDFAITCLKDFEETAQVLITTGQDLGHGIMSDGKTESLDYMYDRFRGSIRSDTSKPTGEGNFHLLHGALQGLGIQPAKAQVGLIGIGHVGGQVLNRLREIGVHTFVLESSEERLAWAAKQGIPTWRAESKDEFLKLPLDALVLNADGGSINEHTLKIICENQAIEFICGSENLAISAPHGAARLMESRKIYCPTELAGMMGYLTAVEEYLSRAANVPFKMEEMFVPARRLEQVGREVCELVVRRNFELAFEDAVCQLYRVGA